MIEETALEQNETSDDYLEKTQFKLNKIAKFSIAFALIISTISLVGWTLQNSILTSLSKTSIPIAPSTAFLLLVFGINLLLIANNSEKRSTYNFSNIASTAIIVFSSVIIFQVFNLIFADVEKIFIKNPDQYQNVFTGRMSPITALLFIVSSFAVLSSSGFLKKYKYSSIITSYLTFTTFITSAIFLMGYLYGVPFLYNIALIPVALPTAMSFFILSFALLLLNGVKATPLKYFFANTVFSQLIIRLIPLVIFTLLLESWLDIYVYPYIDINHVVLTIIQSIILITILNYAVFIVSRRVTTKIDKTNMALKVSEEELRASESKFRGLTKSTPIGIYMTDLDGKCNYVNEQWMHISGLTLEQALGDGWRTAIYTEDRKKLFEKWSNIVNKNIEFSARYRFMTSDKKVIWVDDRATKLLDKNQEHIGFIGSIADITKRKYAEDALRESETKYREVFEGANDAIYIVDPHYQNILDCNKVAVKMTGYTKFELLKMTVADLHPELEKPLLPEKFKLVREKGSAANISGLHHQTKKGKLIDIEVNASIINLAGKQINVSTIRDVTERNKAKVTTNRLSSILENTNDFVGFTDKDGNVLYINAAGKKMIGLKKSNDITKSKISDFHPEWAAKKVLDEGLPIAVEEGIWSGETALLSKSGKEIPTLQTAMVHKNTKGEIEFMSTIMHGISDVKKAESSLLESEEKFKSTFENAPIGIGLVKPSGEIFEINYTWANMVGYTQEELLHKYFKEITYPKDLKISFQIQKDLLMGIKKSASFEKRYVHRSGKIIWVQVDVVLLRDDQNKPLYFITQVIDISKRKENEAIILQRDKDIRKAYVDVFSAVTGGKLIIMTPEEIKSSLGVPLVEDKIITNYEELSGARKLIRETTAKHFPLIKEPEQIILSTGEAITNAVKHAKSGTIQIFKKEDIAQYLIEDFGEGIDFSNLPKATLLSGYSTKQTLGMGFNIMLEYSDRVLLSTQDGYTAIVIEVSMKSLSEKEREEQVLAYD